MLRLENGERGLIYATDTDEPSIFVAAPSREHALVIVEQARKAMAVAAPIELHTWHDHEWGGQMTVPEPYWQTGSQRKETIEKMHRHMEWIKARAHGR